MSVKRIVCLANSRKLSGYCVAGKELASGRWVRPVSARATEEVSNIERAYEGGGVPQVLDIIDVPVIEAKPNGHQQENWLLDSQRRWKKVGRMQLAELPKIVDPIRPLWINSESTAKNLYDQISIAEAATLKTSLRLIEIENLTLSVFTYYNRRRVQGRFKYNRAEYWLWVTDPVYEGPYAKKKDGDYPIGSCWLTISLTEPFVERDACYKVIAAIIKQ